MINFHRYNIYFANRYFWRTFQVHQQNSKKTGHKVRATWQMHLYIYTKLNQFTSICQYYKRPHFFCSQFQSPFLNFCFSVISCWQQKFESIILPVDKSYYLPIYYRTIYTASLLVLIRVLPACGVRQQFNDDRFSCALLVGSTTLQVFPYLLFDLGKATYQNIIAAEITRCVQAHRDLSA